jgi:hypothetical protein
MDLGELRRFIKQTEHLPDKTELIVEQKDGGQDEALSVEVCIYEHGGGLHYSEESFKEEEKGGKDFDPESWWKLDEPTVKITMR